MAELLYINAAGSNVYGSSWTGQSFTPDANWSIDSIWMNNVRSLAAGPFDVTCHIYLDVGDGSAPTGSSLGESGATACSSTLGAKTWTFASPVVVSSGSIYWAILDIDEQTSIWAYRSDSSAYASGKIGAAGAGGPVTGWAADASYDVAQFKVNGTIAAPAVISGRRGFTTRSGILRRR